MQAFATVRRGVHRVHSVHVLPCHTAASEFFTQTQDAAAPIVSTSEAALSAEPTPAPGGYRTLEDLPFPTTIQSKKKDRMAPLPLTAALARVKVGCLSTSTNKCYIRVAGHHPCATLPSQGSAPVLCKPGQAPRTPRRPPGVPNSTSRWSWP